MLRTVACAFWVSDMAANTHRPRSRQSIAPLTFRLELPVEIAAERTKPAIKSPTRR
jgi:hypothetical protein